MSNGFLASSPSSRHGSSEYGWSSGQWAIAQKFTCPGSGSKNVTEIGAWMRKQNSTLDMTIGIFTDDSVNGCPESLVANSEQSCSVSSTSMSKYYQSYSTKPVITGGVDYWIAMQVYGNTIDYLRTDYLSGSGYPSLHRSNTYPTWPTGSEWHTHTDDGSMDNGFYAVCEDAETGHPARKRMAGNPFTPFRKGVW